MTLIVLYFLLSTSVLSFYIDVNVTLSIWSYTHLVMRPQTNLTPLWFFCFASAKCFCSNLLIPFPIPLEDILILKLNVYVLWYMDNVLRIVLFMKHALWVLFRSTKDLSHFTIHKYSNYWITKPSCPSGGSFMTRLYLQFIKRFTCLICIKLAGINLVRRTYIHIIRF